MTTSQSGGDGVAALELFRDCSEVDIARFSGLLDAFAVDTGAVLARQGEASDAFLLLVEGSAVVTRRSAGRDRLLGTIGVGSIVGELGCLLGAPRGATVVATSALAGRRGD